MDAISNAPYAARILGSLLVILLINRFAVPLYLSVMAGTTILYFWAGHNFDSFFSFAHERLLSPGYLFLLAAIFQIIILSGQMLKAGVMKDLVMAVKSIVPHRASLALLPALIGLLPMPGGAIFSAPLVAEIDNDSAIDPPIKSQINYWFRHIWEYWWPLYPGMLLAVEISGLPIPVFISIMFPLTLFSVLGGYLYILRRIPINEPAVNSEALNISLFGLMVPFLLIIGLYASISIFVPGLAGVSRFLPVIIGVTAAQIYLQITRPLDLKGWRTILLNGRPGILIVTVVCILVYGALIEAPLSDGTLIIARMKDELVGLGIPIVLAIGIIPFVSGITTGLALGFVGASFPIVMSMAGSSRGEVLATVVLAYGCGYVGMMFSPVHICLVVTNEYFKTRMWEVLLRLVRPLLVVFSGTLIVYFILKTALS